MSQWDSCEISLYIVLDLNFVLSSFCENQLLTAKNFERESRIEYTTNCEHVLSTALVNLRQIWCSSKGCIFQAYKKNVTPSPKLSLGAYSCANSFRASFVGALWCQSLQLFDSR